MNEFLYWTGVVFWTFVALGIIALTSMCQYKRGKWLMLQLLGVGIAFIPADGNDDFTSRLLRCGYRIRRIGKWWIGFWFSLKG